MGDPLSPVWGEGGGGVLPGSGPEVHKVTLPPKTTKGQGGGPSALMGTRPRVMAHWGLAAKAGHCQACKAAANWLGLQCCGTPETT